MRPIGQGGQVELAASQHNDAPRLRVRRLALFLVLACFGVTADLITKQIAFARLGSPPSPIYWIWEGFFGFETSVNHGALFGMGQGMVPVFATVSFVAIAGLTFWVLIGGALESRLLTVALGLILGGILGNLYDRLGLWGHAGVRDWILCCYESWVWPNFNIADSLLVCGAAMMLWHSWKAETDVAESSSAPQGSS